MDINETIKRVKKDFNNTMEELMKSAIPYNPCELIQSFIDSDKYKKMYNPVRIMEELLVILKSIAKCDDKILNVAIYHHKDEENNLDVYFIGIEEFHSLMVLGKDASWTTYTPKIIVAV